MLRLELCISENVRFSQVKSLPSTPQWQESQADKRQHERSGLRYSQQAIGRERPSLRSDDVGEPAAGRSTGQVKQLERVGQFGCEAIEGDLHRAAQRHRAEQNQPVELAGVGAGDVDPGGAGTQVGPWEVGDDL